MVVTVNGERRELPAGANLVDLVPEAASRRGVAIAVDGTVVPRSAWSEAELPEGARVEIVVAVQGG